MNTNIGSKLLSACAAIGISAVSLLVVTDARAHETAEVDQAKPQVECTYRAFGPAHHPTRERRIRECEYRKETLARQTVEASRKGPRKYR